MTALNSKRPAAIRLVIPFVFRHWLQQPLRASAMVAGFLGATAADLFMPVFSGHLVDAVTLGASDPAARRAAFTAFGAIVALGLVSMTLRLVGLQAIALKNTAEAKSRSDAAFLARLLGAVAGRLARRRNR